jgi:large subunit ribosomal protein L22
MQVKASLKNYRRSARKVREVTSLLRDMGVEEAGVQLMLWKKGCGEDLLKLLKSAVANAQNNFKLREEDLYIAEVKVNEGPTMKRWRARAFGRATQILKRTCHIELILGVREKELSSKKAAKKGKTGNSEKKKKGEVSTGKADKKEVESKKEQV